MNKETVEKVARLSMIEMNDAGLEKMVPQLGKIMGFIEQLSEVNTDNVEPLASVVNIELKLRKDEVNDGGDAGKVLSNAPEETQGFYVVPKVVE